MGSKQIQAAGQVHELDESATVAELKDRVGASEHDLGTYVADDGNWETLSDRDAIRHVPDGATVAFQPDRTIFGARK